MRSTPASLACGDDVATSLDVDGVERRRVGGPEAELGGEMKAVLRAVKHPGEARRLRDVDFASFDVEAVEVLRRRAGLEEGHHVGAAREQRARHRRANESRRARDDDAVAAS